MSGLVLWGENGEKAEPKGWRLELLEFARGWGGVGELTGKAVGGG